MRRRLITRLGIGLCYTFDRAKIMSEAGIKRQVKRHWKLLQEEIASPFPLRGRVPWSMLHANNFGIQAAERLLRHNGPTITSKFYTDRRLRLCRTLVPCWRVGWRRRLNWHPFNSNPDTIHLNSCSYVADLGNETEHRRPNNHGSRYWKQSGSRKAVVG